MDSVVANEPDDGFDDPSVEDRSTGLFDEALRPEAMSMDRLLGIIQARTGMTLTPDDPIVMELVALDAALRHHTQQMGKVITLGGDLMDHQAQQIGDTVGKRIDEFATGAVKAIKENSAKVEAAADDARGAVEKAERTMLRVTTTAKVLLVAAAGFSGVAVVALIAAAALAMREGWLS